MTHVLITGGTGFIGHNVVLDLLGWTDWTFTIIDAHTYAGAPEKLTKDPRFDPSRVNVVTADLTEDFFDAVDMNHWKVYSPFQGGKVYPYPDMIFNIASNSHVDNSINDPVPFIKDNVALTVNMLEFARIAKPKLFIQFSTDEVYGAAPQGVDFPEWSTILPSNPYSASKAAQEAIAISYWRTYGVPLVITNTMNVLGKHQHHEKFVPKTVEYLLSGIPMTVHAEKQEYTQTDDQGLEWTNTTWNAGSRFYTYVTNISSALKFIAEIPPLPYTTAADRPDRYNIVGEREVANDEMVYLISDLLKVEPLIEYVDFHSTRPGHDRRYALDGSKLADLGWKAPISFEEGLRLTVETAKEDFDGRVRA